MPKISIVVPVYNVEKYIDKCLSSLLSQTIKDIEVIIVNDGSKDNSKNIIQKYLTVYPDKIKYYEKENGGLSDARNYGIQYVTGDYIAFLDSDDYVDEDMYEKMYDKAIKTESDMVECDFIWEYEDDEIENRIDTGTAYKNKKDMLVKSRVVAWNKLYKREIIEKAFSSGIQFPKGLNYEDVEFFYKIIPLLNKVSYVRKPFIHYMQRENSISKVYNEKTRNIYSVLGNVLSYYKKQALYSEYRDELEYVTARYILCSSLLRVTKIKNKKLRKEILNEGFDLLYKLFPNWKKNKILNDFSFEKNKKIYMKSVNRLTYHIYASLFRNK